MAVEEDIREMRNDFREVWGEVRKVSTSVARMEVQQESIANTLKEHSRPCKDLTEVKQSVALLTQKALNHRKDDNGGTKEIKEEKNLLRLVLGKIVVPLVAVLALLVGYFCKG